MAEGQRAPLLRAVSGATMGQTFPPESKSQPASQRDDEDPHESVTIAPPAPSFDELLDQAGAAQSLPSQSDRHFRAAMDASARAGSNLGELSKMVAELSSGVVGAKRANERLVQELATLRAMLDAESEQQAGLRRSVAQLEQQLADARAEAERERRFLTDQHDAFLAALLDEHEEALRARDSREDTRTSAEISELARQLAQAEAARQQAELESQRARQALSKAQAQRDEAQARAALRERERDELRAEASMLRARSGTLRTLSTTPPPPVTGSRPPSFRPPTALTLDDGELDSNLHSHRSASRRPGVPVRHVPAPPELEQAVYTPPAPSVPPPSVPPPSSDTATAFPRVSTRPGVGGPKPSEPPSRPSFGPPPSGWTPSPPAPEAAVSAGAPIRPRMVSVASLPPSQVPQRPVLKQKPDPASRPLVTYSLGEDGVQSETLEGARFPSKPPRK